MTKKAESKIEREKERQQDKKTGAKIGMKIKWFISVAIVAGGGLLLTSCFHNSEVKVEAVVLTPPSCFKTITGDEFGEEFAANESGEELSLSEFSIEISKKVFSCSQSVVLAPDTANFEILARANQLAASTSSPLIIYSEKPSSIVDEINRLSPKETIYIGDPDDLDVLFNEAIEILQFRADSSNTSNLAAMDKKIVARMGKAARLFDFSLAQNQQIIRLSQNINDFLENPESRARAESGIFFNLRVDLIKISDELLSTEVARAELPEINELAGTAARATTSTTSSSANTSTQNGGENTEGVEATESTPESRSRAWVFSPEETRKALVALSSIDASGGHLLFFAREQDLRRSWHVGNFLDSSQAHLTVASPIPEHSKWQVEVLANSKPLPSGKYILFDKERIVGFYGHVDDGRLGALGTYATPKEALEAGVEPYLPLYETPGTIMTPAFEIITTVASDVPTENDDYSRETPIANIEPWVDAAEELGAYVILDLQPGRTDFLTQAKQYESLLKREHVGLALDPEWRLRDDQTEFNQIGSVSSREVNEVVFWLAELVRENNLPQKMLILHQFRPSMLPNRERIQSLPELAVVVHMDGQGTLDEKLETYELLARHFPGEPMRFFGWKNFFDEDKDIVGDTTGGTETNGGGAEGGDGETDDTIPVFERADISERANTVLALEPLPDYISYQ